MGATVVRVVLLSAVGQALGPPWQQQMPVGAVVGVPVDAAAVTVLHEQIGHGPQASAGLAVRDGAVRRPGARAPSAARACATGLRPSRGLSARRPRDAR